MAAEVLAIIAAAAGVGKTLIEVSSAVNAFVGIGKEMRAIQEEVKSLEGVNQSFMAALESNKARPTRDWLDMADEIVTRCDATTRQLHSDFVGLNSKGQKVSFRRMVTWSIKRGDIQRYCTLLRSYGEMLGRLQVILIQ
jgi:hypothetical protein